MSDNEQLRDELLAVRDRFGSLTAENVVTAAIPASSPLHRYFEWNDDEAAVQYRLVQARRLIKFVREPYVRPNGEEGRVPLFHLTSQTDGTRAYSPLNEVIRDPVATAVILKQAEREWRALWSRYSHLKEFVEVVHGTVTEAAAALPPA